MRYGKWLKVDEKKLDAFHRFYERYGNAVVFFCRFIPVIRGVSALPAGVSRMQKRYFILYTLAGSAIFCFGLAALGNAFGRHYDTIAPSIRRLSMEAAIACVVLVAIVIGFRIARGRRARTAA